MKLFEKLPPLTDEQRSIIYGSLLGDGCISKDKKNSNRNCWFTINQRESCKELVYWHHDMLFPYSGKVISRVSNKIKHENGKMLILNEPCGLNYVYYTKHHPIFTEIRKLWYDENGIKHVPSIKLNSTILSLWYVEDGQNVPTRRCVYFHTDGFDDRDCSYLVSELSAMNFSVKMVKSKNKNKIRINTSSYLDFINYIKSHILWKCFSYKSDLTRYTTPRVMQGQSHPQARITENIAKNIIKLFSNGEKQATIAEQLSLSPQLVSKIIRGDRWKHLERPWRDKNV